MVKSHNLSIRVTSHSKSTAHKKLFPASAKQFISTRLPLFNATHKKKLYTRKDDWITGFKIRSMHFQIYET